jgi:hypothetical protein
MENILTHTILIIVLGAISHPVLAKQPSETTISTNDSASINDQLTLEDISAYIAQKNTQSFTDLDVNNDNLINLTEFIVNTNAKTINLATELFNTADTDANDTLNIDEFAATLYGNIRLAGIQKYIGH